MALLYLYLFRWICMKRLCELHLSRFGIRVFLLLGTVCAIYVGLGLKNISDPLNVDVVGDTFS